MELTTTGNEQHWTIRVASGASITLSAQPDAEDVPAPIREALLAWLLPAEPELRTVKFRKTTSH